MAEINDLTTTNQTNNPRWTEGVQLIPQINDSARDLEAIVARWYRDERGSLSATGGPTVYALSAGQVVSVLFDGFRVSALWPQTCNDNPTLNVNGTGARPIVVQNGTNALEDDLIGGAIYDLVFRSGLWHVLNPTLNRRRAEIRLQPGNTSILRFEGFSEATSGDFLLFRGFGRNAADQTIEYGEYRVGVRNPATGNEEGRLTGSVVQNGIEKTMFQFEGNQAALLGAALRGANTLALPSGAKIFEGTRDLLEGTGPKRILKFSSSGSFAKLPNSKGIVVFVQGGGGGGARGVGVDNIGGAGGSGGLAINVLPASSLPNNVNFTIGSGGAGGAGAGTNGSTGGNSSFQNLTGFGGIGGLAGGSAGNGGTATGGNANFSGVRGASAGSVNGNSAIRSSGGSGLLFGAGTGGNGSSNSGTTTAGSAGAIMILEF